MGHTRNASVFLNCVKLVVALQNKCFETHFLSKKLALKHSFHNILFYNKYRKCKVIPIYNAVNSSQQQT